MGKVQTVVEKNRNVIFGIIGALLVGVLGYFGYKAYTASQDEDGQAKLFSTMYKFEADSNKVAAKEATSTGLKTLLSSYVEQRSRFADELQSEVERLGWKPETDGSVAGNLHRTWMAVKSAVTNRDDAAILAECETGEQVAVETYEMALRHKDLPPRSLSAIERQYNMIVSGRNSMNVLHDQKAM